LLGVTETVSASSMSGSSVLCTIFEIDRSDGEVSFIPKAKRNAAAMKMPATLNVVLSDDKSATLPEMKAVNPKPKEPSPR